jgi:pimeloyl-ACP methyl ester carboxylesterase
MSTTFLSVNKGTVINDLLIKSVDINRKQLNYTEGFSPENVLPTIADPPKPTKTIICFHGSPGCKEDFGELEYHLSPFSIHAFPRKNYPGFSNSFFDYIAQRKNQVLIGYSWGCRELLEYYIKNHSNIDTIILISPYILNSSKSSLLMKCRPIMGCIKRILMTLENHLSNKSMNNNNKIYKHTKHTMLKRSLLYLCGLYEKTEHQVISYASILRLIAEFDTPVHVITGARDTSTRSQQSKELIKAINCNVVCYAVNDGNHDLLKTHVQQLARIVKLITHSFIEIDQKRFKYQYRESTQHYV